MNASGARIGIVLNGEQRAFAAPLSVAGLLDAAGFGGRRVAVEINREIVPKSQHAIRMLADADRVEIVHALGGG
jgi:sulfur carrier protein